MVNVSEGMTLTIHNFQTKLFTSIAAAAAVIGTSFVSVSPAEARTYQASCNFNNEIRKPCTVGSSMGFLKITWKDGLREVCTVGRNIIVTDKRGVRWLSCLQSSPS